MSSEKTQPTVDRGPRNLAISNAVGDQREFADQLFGASSTELKSPVHNASQKNPGRRESALAESDEGSRANEREPASKSSSPSAASHSARAQGRSTLQSKSKAKPSAQSASIESRVERSDAKPGQPRAIKSVQVEPGNEPSNELAPESVDELNSDANAESASIEKPVQLSQTKSSVAAIPLRKTQAQHDPMVVAIKRDNAVLEGLRAVEEQDRDDAMENFLDRMQNEFGISPDKVMQAFQSLDIRSLAAPASETADQVLAKMGIDQLPKEQQLGVKQAYHDMVLATGEADLNEKMISIQESVNDGALSELQADATLRHLNQALEELNQAFEPQDPADRSAIKASSARAGSASADAVAKMDLEIAQLMRRRDAVASSMMSGEASSADVTGPGALAIARARGLSEDDLDNVDASGDDDDSSASELTAARSMAVRGSHALNEADSTGRSRSHADKAAGAAAVGQRAAVDSAHSASSRPASQSSSAGSSASLASGATSAAVSATPAVSTTNSTAIANAAVAGDTSAVAPKVASGSAAGLAASQQTLNRPVTQEEEKENTRELIQQAKLVIKQGGGEMRMEMKPEGLGQVHLKVNVDNGQVTVQMVTETEQAKHLLEKSLGDLKANLAAHHLRVEHMKVDVGQEIQKQMDQQSQRESSRQAAQDFLGQFREERQEFRDNQMNGNGWKQYGHGPKRAKVAPDEVAAQAAVRASASARQGLEGMKRLNLVA